MIECKHTKMTSRFSKILQKRYLLHNQQNARRRRGILHNIIMCNRAN
jgi:hypothetical protein